MIVLLSRRPLCVARTHPFTRFGGLSTRHYYSAITDADAATTHSYAVRAPSLPLSTASGSPTRISETHATDIQVAVTVGGPAALPPVRKTKCRLGLARTKRRTRQAVGTSSREPRFRRWCFLVAYLPPGMHLSSTNSHAYTKSNHLPPCIRRGLLSINSTKNRLISDRDLHAAADTAMVQNQRHPELHMILPLHPAHFPRRRR